MKISIILRLLDAILLLLPRAIALYSRIEAIREELAAMGTEDPTDEQWARTGAATDERLARLRARESV